ncbi:MAG: S9 family peptidase [Candidatus Aminicenantes bacterium]|nr:S9 family peptidase [Candidatus Aminicenantes bacterium]
MKKNARLIMVMVGLFWTGALGAEDAATPIFQAADHLKQVAIGAPQVSPDGQWILYSLSMYCAKEKSETSDLFLLPFAGGLPRQLTHSTAAEKSYCWSPDSRSIAFSAKRDGDAKSQIYILPLNGGEAWRLTSLAAGASDPLWSPDGKTLAFYSEVGELYSPEQKEAFGAVRYAMHPRYHHLGKGWDNGKRQRIFVIPARGGAALQLTGGACADEGDHSMVWRNDSRVLAFVSNRSPEWWNTIDTDIYQVDIAGKELKRLTRNPGPDHSPIFSPDGKWLAWRASYEYNYESEDYKIHVQPVAGDESHVLAAKLDRDVNLIQWAPDSRGLYFTAGSEGRSNIQYVSLARPERWSDITRGQNNLFGWKVAGKQRFAMIRTTDTCPGEIYTFNQGRFKRLTTAAEEPFNAYKRLPSEEIWITADDGSRVQGWLIRPLGYREGLKTPLILSIHGGPHGMSAPTFRFDFQLYAHHGFAVLYTNPRGSNGYGQKFKDVTFEDWGTKPMADLMMFVDLVIGKGIADPSKLAVTGGSYGGFMTNWLITHSGRFAVAVSVAGLYNMTSFWGTTDEQFFAEKEMAGLPWQKQDVYIRNSPIWNSERLKTPTMVIHGANDWRVRPEQGEQLFSALQKMGVPSVYVNFPEEQHGIRGKINRTLYNRLLLEWFEHWLLGKEVKLATYLQPIPYSYPPRSVEKK